MSIYFLGNQGSSDMSKARVCLGWKPDRSTSWYEGIVKGQICTEAPFLIRPVVQGESPALWYIEDGSGRGIVFVAKRASLRPIADRGHWLFGTRAGSPQPFYATTFSR